MARIGAAILVLAGICGARGAVRELAAPFEGLEWFAQARPTRTPEPTPATRFDEEIPPDPDSGAMNPLPEELAENPERLLGVEVIYHRDEQGRVEVFTLSATQESADSAANASGKSAWAEWKERAILALPKDLRCDSDQRRAIDWLYLSAAEVSIDELAVDIISRPPIGGYDIGGVGFTDIDERAEIVYDLRARPEEQSEWAAFWEDWKARAIAALPESERNDPNRLKEIDTTLGQVKQSAGGPSAQELRWNRIVWDVTITQQKAHGAK